MITRKVLAAGTVMSIFCAAIVSMAADKEPDVSAVEAPKLKKVPAKRAAQEKPAKLGQLTTKEIVARNVKARGGLKAWQKIESMTIAGKLDAGNKRKDGGNVAVADTKLARAQARAEARRVLLEKKAPGADSDKIIQLPFQLDMKRPLKTRLEIPFQGQIAVQVYDGIQGWKLRPFLGRHEVEPFTAQEMKIAADQQPLDGPLIDYKAKGTKIEAAGIEKVDGNDTYKLRLTLKNGDVRHIWVDAKTFLEVKFEDPPRHFDGKMRSVMTAFRDYKTINGLVIPHVLETSMEGVQSVERIIIENVAINPKFDDARFAKPI